MIPLDTLRELLDYNYWARDRQLEACAALSGEAFLRPVGGSFSSMRDTLAHMAAVEWLWLERWRGRSPKSMLPPGDFPNLVALAQRWRAIESELRQYVAGLDDETLARPQTYVSTRGESWTYPLWRMVHHLLNHQSYHRGQVTTLLRVLGAEPARVDYLVALDAGILRAK